MLKHLFTLVVLILFACGASLAEPSAHTDHKDTNNPKTVEIQADLKPSSVASDDAESREQPKYEKCEYDGPKWFARFYCFFAEHDKFWVSFGTLILAAVTTILGFATIVLAKATNRLVKDAEDTAERQLRAYVFLDSIDLRRFTVPNNNWRIMIAWKNTGGTRTRRFIAKVSHDVIDLSRQSLETFDFHDEPNAQTFHGLIGPNQSVNQPPIPVAKLHLLGASAEDTALLIWGWAEYQDVFDDTIHRTEFGFRIWIEGNIHTQSLIRFEPTEKHNAADEDCMKSPSSLCSS